MYFVPLEFRIYVDWTKMLKQLSLKKFNSLVTECMYVKKIFDVYMCFN